MVDAPHITDLPKDAEQNTSCPKDYQKQQAADGIRAMTIDLRPRVPAKVQQIFCFRRGTATSGTGSHGWVMHSVKGCCSFALLWLVLWF